MLLPLTLILALVLSCVAVPAAAQSPAATSTPDTRPRVALALGGGAARGLAHVGVLRWLEEHHIPIDAIAGTSMGGLIGGAYATGMSPDDLEALILGIDWDAMFGASGFRFDHVRRKRDLRQYSSRLEFGLKHPIGGPPALNNGQQVGLLLSRITAAYYRPMAFDDLPTPFRAVAVDLRTAKPVIIRDGPLSLAMRATIAMPLTFPPVVVGDQLLVDGGALNNLPIDVARSMKADRVIAVNVSDLGAKPKIDTSLLGLVAETMDAMVRANTASYLTSADVVITVPLPGVLANDFDRAPEVIKAGYDAAEAARDRLLPLALNAEQWERAREARRAATLARLPRPAWVHVDGAGTFDTKRMEQRLAVFQDSDVDIDAIELALSEIGGLDRFETLTWRLDSVGGKDGLLVTALPKSYGPPFLFLGGSLENTTSNEFRLGLGARYLAFDVLGSGTELRIDGALGSEPAIRAAWYRPIANTPFFIEPVAQAATTRISIIEDDRIVAEYGRRRLLGGVDLGFNPGRLNEIRLGARAGRTDATVRIGDPDYPDIKGDDVTLLGSWTYDTQDDPLLPRRGLHVVSTLTHFLEAPVSSLPDDRSSLGVTKLESSATWFRPMRTNRVGRMLAFGGVGTSFDGHPLVIDQFELGGPARLTAFGIGEARGDHYAYAGAGYLHHVFTLPDFLGRSVFAGGWLESGSAFDRASDAKVAVHGTVTVIGDTLIGPMFAGASLGIDGKSRFYLGIGKIFK